jgi:hypothetical protein
MNENIVEDAVQKSRIHPGVKIVLGILAVLFWVSCLQLVPNDHLLSLRITSDWAIYHLKSNILITIQLTNVSNHSVLVNGYLTFDEPYFPPPIRTISFEIKDPSGVLLSSDVIINKRMIRESDFLLLSPGESTEIKYCPSCYFHFEEIGDYSIRVCYENSVDPAWLSVIESSGVSDYDLRNAWKGIICSNEITIRVEP